MLSVGRGGCRAGRTRCAGVVGRVPCAARTRFPLTRATSHTFPISVFPYSLSLQARRRDELARLVGSLEKAWARLRNISV